MGRIDTLLADARKELTAACDLLESSVDKGPWPVHQVHEIASLTGKTSHMIGWCEGLKQGFSDGMNAGIVTGIVISACLFYLMR